MVGCHVTDAIVTECHSVAEYPHNPFAVLSIPAAGTGRFKHNFAFYRGGIVGDNGTTVQGGTIIARSVRQLAASLSPDAAKLIKEGGAQLEADELAAAYKAILGLGLGLGRLT